MMQRRFKQVDVFTAVPYQGNPVAVIIDGDGLTTEQMQGIARWTNLSETTFVCRAIHADADYRLRIFTPGNELPFGGHPTIGTAHALLTSGITPKRAGALVQECGVGLVHLQTNGDSVRIALPSARFTSIDDATRTMLEQAIDTRLLHAPAIVNLGATWLTGQVASGELLRALQPDMAILAALSTRFDITGINLFGLDGDVVEVRSFAPHLGITEDPVCGTGNGAVAYYLREQRGPVDYAARQGRCIARDGHITVAYDADGTVWLGGQAVTCIEGTIVA